MKKFIQNPFVLTVISTLILTPIGSWIYDHTKNVPILTNWVLKPLHTVWDLIKAVVTYQVPVWGIFAVIIGLILLLWLIDKIFYSKPVETITHQRNNAPEFLNYKQGILKSWKWSWSYNINSSAKTFEIVNLIPMCTKCDLKMLEDSFGDVWVCPNCNHQKSSYINPEEQPVKIAALIQDRIEKKNY